MKEMDSLLPRGAAILPSAAFDPVDLGMLDSCLLGKLLLRHASLKPRFDHRAHDLGLGLKGIPFLSEFWIFQILLQVPCEIHIILPDEGYCPIVKMPTGKSFGPSGLSLVPLWKRRAGGRLHEPSSLF